MFRLIRRFLQALERFLVGIVAGVDFDDSPVHDEEERRNVRHKMENPKGGDD